MKFSAKTYLAAGVLAIAATNPATAGELKQWWPLKASTRRQGRTFRPICAAAKSAEGLQPLRTFPAS